MRYIDPPGLPRKERKTRTIYVSEDEYDWLKKQLEIYRERIAREQSSPTEERTGNSHEEN